MLVCPQRTARRYQGSDLNPPGIDDHTLNLCPPPIAAPPGNVVATGITLGNVGLSPANSAAIPGFGCRRSRLAGAGVDIEGENLQVRQSGGARGGFGEERPPSLVM